METNANVEKSAPWLLRNPWVVIAVAGLILFAFWARGTRTTSHDVRAVFDYAPNLFSGLDVRVDGLDAGKIKKVEQVDDKAVVTLGIHEDRFWPLRQGTTATLRFGTTIGNATRIIDLDPGPSSARAIPNHGVIDNARTNEATEFDEVFDTLDAKTRESLQGTLKGTGDTFGPRAKQLGSGLQASAPGLRAVGGLATDLARDQVALSALVANTARVTSTLAARREAISGLVSVASATFDAFARNTAGIKGSLERFPPAVREARTTLAHLDGTVDRLDALTADLRPGAAQLGGLSRELRPALASLRETVPSAVATFRTARTAAPHVTKLLRQAVPFSTPAAPALTELAPIMSCIRPYAPEIAGLLSTWSSFTKNYDGIGHLARLWGNFGPTSLTSTPPVDTEAFTKATGQGYALVRPPGYNAGKPWFLPECGAGPEGVDPAKDPEDGK